MNLYFYLFWFAFLIINYYWTNLVENMTYQKKIMTICQYFYKEWKFIYLIMLECVIWAISSLKFVYVDEKNVIEVKEWQKCMRD
jgi:hypothetical protein